MTSPLGCDMETVRRYSASRVDRPAAPLPCSTGVVCLTARVRHSPTPPWAYLPTTRAWLHQRILQMVLRC